MQKKEAEYVIEQEMEWRCHGHSTEIADRGVFELVCLKKKKAKKRTVEICSKAQKNINYAVLLFFPFFTFFIKPSTGWRSEVFYCSYLGHDR